MVAVAVAKFTAHRGRIARMAFTIVAGVAVMTLAAKVQIPFWPVPMTLHTLAVMAFAVALGPRVAVSICVAYLAAGAVGFPVFSGSPERGVGLAYMVGPTGGYLVGFVVASWLVGVLAAGKATLVRFVAMLTGLVVIYAFGVAWLAHFVPAGKLLSAGVLPFLPGDLVKIALVAFGSLALAGLIRKLDRRSR